MASANTGSFVWYEHVTKDVRKAIAFYSEVVGWKTERFGQADYTMWAGSQGPLGGVIGLTPEMEKAGVPPHWFAHVQVSDVDRTAALARKLGGKVVKEPEDIPTVGRFAVIADPQGAVLAVFAPRNQMPPRDLGKDGEFCWNELMTSDAAAAWRFYAELFGWKVQEDMDMGPMGTYRIFGPGEDRVGGIMTAPKDAGMPPSWIFYASTSDLDAALARATAKGGKILNGPMDIPGGGRIAQLTDPQGALFALHQAPRK
jgi:predicted enzyme related to lactoylglutathione lyase